MRHFTAVENQAPPTTTRTFPDHFHCAAASRSLNQGSNSHQHIQLCGYSQRGSPLRELVRNVNTSETVTGTIIYLGSVLHWCRALLCVCCCQLLINPCGVSQNTVEDRAGKERGNIVLCASLPVFFLHHSIDSILSPQYFSLASDL